MLVSTPITWCAYNRLSHLEQGYLQILRKEIVVQRGATARSLRYFVRSSELHMTLGVRQSISPQFTDCEPWSSLNRTHVDSATDILCVVPENPGASCNRIREMGQKSAYIIVQVALSFLVNSKILKNTL